MNLNGDFPERRRDAAALAVRRQIQRDTPHGASQTVDDRPPAGADPKVRYGRALSGGTTALIHVWITLPDDRPFVFDTVESFGSTTAAIALGAEPARSETRVSSTTQQRALPLDGAVVRFR